MVAKKKSPEPAKPPRPKNEDAGPFEIRRLAWLGVYADHADILRMLAGFGASAETAAAMVGLSPAAFAAMVEAPGPLGEAWRLGPETANVQVVKALHDAATAGDAQAMKFWLVNRCPVHFAMRGAAPPNVDDPAPKPADARRILEGLKVVA